MAVACTDHNIQNNAHILEEDTRNQVVVHSQRVEAHSHSQVAVRSQMVEDHNDAQQAVHKQLVAIRSQAEVHRHSLVEVHTLDSHLMRWKAWEYKNRQVDV